MKKVLKKTLISSTRAILLLIVILALTVSCRAHAPSTGGGNIRPSDKIENRLTPDEYKIATFENGSPQGFHWRNDRGNGYPFKCEFRGSNISFENGVMKLILNKVENKYIGVLEKPTSDNYLLLVSARQVLCKLSY